MLASIVMGILTGMAFLHEGEKMEEGHTTAKQKTFGGH